MNDSLAPSPPTTPATGSPREALPVRGDAQSSAGDAPAPPCTLVIFGAGGDLTKRLLMPALYDLAGAGLLDPDLKVIGIDHAENTDEGWRASLSAALEAFAKDASAEFHPD